MSDAGTIFDVVAFAKLTDHEIAETLAEWQSRDDELPTVVQLKAFIENVHSMPGQGVCSVFSFGDNCGFIRGVLTALKIPYEKVTPQKWQQALSCNSKKGMTKVQHKNQTKAKAQQLWPDRTWTHAIADAALIAEYGRRVSK